MEAVDLDNREAQSRNRLVSGAGVVEAFCARVGETPHAPAYQEFDTQNSEWRSYTWQEAFDLVQLHRARLAHMPRGERVALLLANGVEWVTLDIAAQSLGLVVVPLYGHDSAERKAFILRNARARALVISNQAQWRDLESNAARPGDLQEVLIADGAYQGSRRHDGPTLAPLRLPASGSLVAPPWSEQDPDAVATIIYTSGTTGLPKGVMLSQRALVRNAEAVAKLIPPRGEDVFLSCLPLAHAFERTVGCYVPMLGGSSVIYARSIELLKEELRLHRPTVLLAVPRLYERIWESVLAAARPASLRYRLLQLAADLGWRRFEHRMGRGLPLSWSQSLVASLLDRLVSRTLMDALGGRLRVAVTGGAALREPIQRGLIGLGLPLVEGYGLTEAGPVVATNTPDDNLPGSIGKPLPGVTVRLSGSGELLVKSPSCMIGYWDDDALSRQAVDAEGWLHTGDLARFADEHLYIVGRLKDLIVLSTGEKVAPSEIDARVAGSDLYDHVLFIGNDRPFVAGLVALNREAWKRFSTELGLTPDDLEAPDARAAILRRFETELSDLPRHAKVRDVHLTLDKWTVGNGLLTPLLKVRRAALEARYASEIEALYARGASRRMSKRD
jgi:long-chain acyl-CoA synthetase